MTSYFLGFGKKTLINKRFRTFGYSVKGVAFKKEFISKRRQGDDTQREKTSNFRISFKCLKSKVPTNAKYQMFINKILRNAEHLQILINLQ